MNCHNLPGAKRACAGRSSQQHPVEKAISTMLLAVALANRAWGGETNTAATLRLADAPANSLWVAHLDCERLLASATGRLLLAQLENPEVKQGFTSFEASAGFDPRRQIRALTLYSVGLAGDDPILLVYGGFDPDKLIALARTLPDYQTTGETPRVVHHWGNAPNASERTYAAIFERGVVIFGRKQAAVLAALDVLEHKAPSLAVGERFPALGDESEKSIVTAGAMKTALRVPPPFDGLARLVKSAVLKVSETNSRVTAKLLLEAEDAPTATQLLNLGQGVIALMKLDSSKPDTVKLAESLSLSQDGPWVAVCLVMPPQELAENIIKGIAKNFIPPPPPFPCFTNRDTVIAEAQAISDGLEAHVKAWMEGKASALLPESVLPKGLDVGKLKDFRLQRFEEIDTAKQWGLRPAEPINFQALRGSFPDPHATYIVLPTLFVPFGSRVIVEGDFPHCRFFDIQVTTSFHPEAYRFGPFGVGEVSIVDADIEPLPGSVNPFRVGAARDATNRQYRVTFEMAVGNPAKLDPAFHPPWYRAPGNRRVGGAIHYQGPWAMDKKYGHGRGWWDVGQIWIRYYAPDKGVGALGGVPWPKVHYELPDGRRYFIHADWSAFAADANRTRPAIPTPPREPTATQGPAMGWDMQFGIFRAIVGGIARETGWADQEYVRALDLGVTGRGEDVPAPGNYAPSATCCNHINYLTRGMSLGTGKVVVVTGRLPTTPRTRNGEPKMEAAQARYWSLTGYDQGGLDREGFYGAAVHSVMDDEIKTDGEQRYVLVFSRAADQPKNAEPDNNVTWVEWGPGGSVGWTLRWLSVGPEWSFEKTPHELNLTWAAGWASRSYNPNLVGRNSDGGFLREYQPIVHYMTKAQFEALGDNIRPGDVPAWK